jgi:hypothetical protein
MDWILHNLETVVVPIIIFILYSIGNKAQNKEKSKGQTPDSSEEQVNSNEAERVRHIQEEIRRKIAERTGRVPPPLQEAPAPVKDREGHKQTYQQQPRRPQSRPVQKFPEPSRRPKPPPLSESGFQVESYEKDIEAKLRKVRELESQLKGSQIPAAWGTRFKTSSPRGELRKQLFKDLSHPLGQKKAILISEILGSPVGVKGPAG